jgi:uncharacterized membrane protein YgcG
MTEPRGDGPRGPGDDDLAAGGLGDLDLALDELAAGRDVPTERVGGETAALATLATELRAAVPPPPAGAAERGRAAFLAPAASGRAALVATAAGCRARGRSLPLRMAAVAAALVVLVALPATARQARPGTTLWPVRQVGQQVRDRLADDPVGRAHLRLNTAESYLAAGAGAGEDRRKDMADRAEEKVEDALDVLDGVAGLEAAAEWARAQQLLPQVDALEYQEDPEDRSGSGSGSGSGKSGSGSTSRSGTSGSGSSSLSGKSGSGSGDD